MLKSFLANVHWFFISLLLMAAFFGFCYLFTYFGGNLNFSIGSSYNSFTVTGESLVQTTDPDISNVSPEVNSARDQAYRNATSIAEELSKLSGLKLGKVTSVSEYLDRNPMPIGADIQPTRIEAASSSSTLKMSVTVTYQIR